MNRIFMGFDKREKVAYDVAEHSILSRTQNAKVIPLKLSELPMLKRPIEIRDGKMYDPISEANMSTEFAVSRFCTFFLQKQGWSLFVDCDIICLDDIQKLFDLADERYAVMCVKHNNGKDYFTAAGNIKMDGQLQTYYNRKCWSSVMLVHHDHPSNKIFDLQMLNEYPGRDLHAFCWLSDEEIGELPQEWNFLVGVNYPTSIAENILHYTLGTPNLKGHENCHCAQTWFDEESRMIKNKINAEAVRY